MDCAKLKSRKRVGLPLSIASTGQIMNHASIKNKKPVKSLVKALRILNALGECSRGLGITDLSSSVKSPKSTVHRLVATMESAGYVIFDPLTTKSVLGCRLTRLGEQLNQQIPLQTFGVPALEQLTRECHEASHLAILQGTEIVYISQEESKEPVRISFNTGHRAPAHCTALGKVFLAGLSDGEILALYANKKKLVRLTPRTQTKLDDLLCEISAVRREGIACDGEEYMTGLACMAAPVRDFSSRTIAAIGFPPFLLKLDRHPQPLFYVYHPCRRPLRS